jgi:hypothetical protein
VVSCNGRDWYFGHCLSSEAKEKHSISDKVCLCIQVKSWRGGNYTGGPCGCSNRLVIPYVPTRVGYTCPISSWRRLQIHSPKREIHFGNASMRGYLIMRILINYSRKALCDKAGCVISGFRRAVDKICVLLGYYTALSGSSLRMFSVPFLRVKISSWTSWPLKMGPISCPETSVNNYHSTLRNIPEERRSHEGGCL